MGAFDLWVTFPFKTVSRLFATLLNLAANDPEYVAQRVPARKFFHVLGSLYGANDKGPNGPGDKPALDSDELLLVRTLVTQTLFVLLSRQEHRLTAAPAPSQVAGSSTSAAATSGAMGSQTDQETSKNRRVNAGASASATAGDARKDEHRHGQPHASSLPPHHVEPLSAYQEDVHELVLFIASSAASASASSHPLVVAGLKLLLRLLCRSGGAF